MCLFLVPSKLKKNGYFPQTNSNFIIGKKFNSFTSELPLTAIPSLQQLQD
jgi:hypothetical protein